MYRFCGISSSLFKPVSLCLPAFLLLGAPAAADDELTNLTIHNDGGFVIASDAGNDEPDYNRDAVRVSYRYTAVQPGGGTAQWHFRFTHRLIDEATGEPVLLLDGEDVVEEIVEFETITLYFPHDYEETVNRAVRLYPHGAIGSTSDHRVEVKVERSLDMEGPWEHTVTEETDPETLYHFTWEEPNDGGRRVVASPRAISFDETAIVDPDSTHNEFEATVALDLLRYADIEEGPGSETVQVHFDLLLERVSDGDRVILEDSRVTHTATLQNYSVGSDPVEPSATLLWFDLSFRPAGQLDSVVSEYRLHVEVSVAESGFPGWGLGSPIAFDPERLLHLNGTVLFGEVETEISSVASRPAYQSMGAGAVNIWVPITEAFAGGDDEFFYNGDLNLELLPNGNARAPSGTAVPLQPTASFRPYIAGRLEFAPQNVMLDHEGAEAGRLVLGLPAGAALLRQRPDGEWPRIANDAFRFSGVKLGPDFFPTENNVLQPVSGMRFSVDALPLVFDVSEVEWNVAESLVVVHPAPGGVELISEERYQYFENPLGGTTDDGVTDRQSNDLFFRFVNSVETAAGVAVRVGNRGEALVDASMTIGAGEYEPHFPLGTTVAWQGQGALVVKESHIDPASHLDGVTGVAQEYRTGCPGECTTGEIPGAETIFHPEQDRLHFTAEGGLHAAGYLANDLELYWGELDGQDPVHGVLSFAQANLYIPGTFLPEPQRHVESPDEGPATLLLSGADPDNPAQKERFGDPEFLTGLGDYAGLNFRTSGELGLTTIGGQLFDFTLSERSKYYIRFSGVAGIHEAAELTDADREIYGYQFSFRHLGLSFLSGNNHDSRLNGHLDVPEPSGIQQAFERMTLTCFGAIDGAQPAEDSLEHMLAFWRADIQVHALQFEPDMGFPCDPSQAYLTMGVTTEPRGIGVPVHGILGFFAEGELIAAENSHLTPFRQGPAGVDSRLIAPANLRLAGPGNETYPLNPVTDLYYNSHYLADEETTVMAGYLAMASHMGVAFFENLQVFLHLDPRATFAGGGADGQVHVMGGWPVYGWEDDGQHFFNHDSFDAANRAYPPGETAESYRLAGVRDPTDSEHLPRAQRQWLKVINFDYPLVWNHVTRSFSSPVPLGRDLLVIEVDHQARYLSARLAELYFGAEFSGIPEINAVNFLYEKADGVVGTAEAFVNSVSQAGYDNLMDGIDASDRLLDDISTALFSALLDHYIDPLLDNLVDAINAYVSTFGDIYDLDVDSIISDADNLLALWDAHLDGVESIIESHRGVLELRIRSMFGDVSNAVDSPTNLIGLIDQELETIQNSLRTLRPGTFTVDGQAVEGLLTQALDGRRGRLVQLIEELAGEELGAAIGGAITGPIESLLELAEPTFGQIEAALDLIDGRIAALRERLDEGSGEYDDFAEEIKNRLAGAEQAIEDVIDGFYAGILDHYRMLPRYDNRLADIYFSEDDEGDPDQEDRVEALKEELMASLRHTFEDRFYASSLMGVTHDILRERVHDIYLWQQEIVDTLFGEVNKVVKFAFTEILGPVEDKVNEVIGALNDAVETANIRGHAHIQGDALRRLRLDGDFVFHVPDEVAFGAYLQIEQMRSESAGGPCGVAPGERTAEVTLGAMNVPVGWVSSGLRADVDAKFSFEMNGFPIPVGFTGSFNLTEGTVGFEAIEIEGMQAILAFGIGEDGAGDKKIQEAYLMAQGGIRFRGNSARGGLFFGQSCTLDPIEALDPDVANILDGPGILGIYGYGETTIDITEQLLGISLGCILDITGSVGAGFFYLQQATGSHYGGSLFAALSGRVACIVSGSGELSMTAASTSSGVDLTGRGAAEGKVGKGRLSKTYRRAFWAEYIDGNWDGGRL